MVRNCYRKKIQICLSDLRSLCQKAPTMIAVVLIVVVLSGCGNGGDTSSKPISGKTSVSDTADETGAIEGSDIEMYLEPAELAISDRKVRAEQSGVYDKVIVTFFDWTGAPEGLDRINARLSAHTEETLGLDVELKIIGVSTYTDDLMQMLEEGSVDLYSSCGPGYMRCVNGGYALNLEENGLLDYYGEELKDIVRTDYLEACRVGGKLFGAPPIKDYAIQTAMVCIGTEYLEGAEVDLNAYTRDDLGYYKCSWDDIDEIFAALHEAFPNKIVFSTQDNMLTQGSSIDPVGGDFFGALLDPANELKLSNTYESAEFREWCERFYRWNQAGYIAKDALEDKSGASARIKEGGYMAMMASGKPAYENQITGECGRPMTVFDVGESFLSSSSVSQFPWCICSKTKDPVAAMQVLNAFYSDPVVANLACWGEEGVEYVVNSDTSITWGPGVDAATSEYYPNVLWLMPNQYAAHVWEGDPPDIGQQTMDFNDSCTNRSKALGFTWDMGELSDIYDALNDAYSEYAPALIYGFTEPSKGIRELNNALKAAGLDEYMEAKQKALDDWAWENQVR